MSSHTSIATAVVQTTGEVLEYMIETPGEVSRAFADVQAHIRAYKEIERLLMATGMELLSRQDKEQQHGK